ncbi:hypothetical protein AMTR_s00162p00035640 [Amborella trichopoda]|uniref:Aminotransferase-like plant mobile domain-containing protein n=1 Tax=Amborella trichopoda TaxID=13333 RepID=W1PNG3_AMBTC|nr:hypothetical protein AMTR_s00162p00035640 [Amborella trichopoda]
MPLLVSWTPYEDEPDIGEEDEHDQAYVREVCATRLCRTYLIFGHVCEGYMPDHILLQFRFRQLILVAPLQWQRREKHGQNPESWASELQTDITLWERRLKNMCQGGGDMADDEPSEEYVAWYRLKTRLIIHNYHLPRTPKYNPSRLPR